MYHLINILLVTGLDTGTEEQVVLGIQRCQICPAGYEIIVQLSTMSTSKTANLKLRLFAKKLFCKVNLLDILK